MENFKVLSIGGVKNLSRFYKVVQALVEEKLFLIKLIP